MSSNDSINDFIEKADNDKLKLCEAYCYIGYKLLFNGNNEKAKEYFIKSKNMNVIHYIEYDFSKFEIKNL